MNVLITTPSLNLVDNVSGISSMVRLLIEHNVKDTYIPFFLGKKDRDKRNLLWLLSLLKIPFRLLSLLRRNSIDMAHFNIGFEPNSLLRDIVPFLILSYKRIPLCLHIHGGRYMSSIPNNLLLKVVISIFFKKATQIIVLSDAEADFLKSNYSALIKKPLIIIPNAVDVPATLDKSYQGVLNLLYLGRLDRKKGLETIADVLNLLASHVVPFKFHLCGNGPDKELFMSFLEESTKPFVIDHGIVSGKLKADILKLSHLFVLPSFFEGLPMALLESMGYAVLPLVSPVGSMPKVVTNKYNGFLIQDAKSLFSIIKELDENREMLAEMALIARDTIEHNFSMTNYVSQINRIYSQVMTQ